MNPYRIIKNLAAIITLVLFCLPGWAASQSLEVPSAKWGISIGNSPAFTGLRFNYRDNHVQYVNGINVTIWQPFKENQPAEIQGISLGLLPGGGNLTGIQLGLVGIAANKNVSGISVAVVGFGAGGSVTGISLSGIGMGTGGDVKGLHIAGIGVGAGGNVSGITVSGIGVGGGKNVTGLNFALVGIGASENLSGITLAGIGAGAGGDVTGVSLAGLGFGAGKNVRGLTIAGLGVGAGETISGVTFTGLGAGAKKIQGLTIAGLGIGAEHLAGVHLALGNIRVLQDGRLCGLSMSGFNYIRGTQNGISIGLINYAYRLKGMQFGLINIVRDNPKLRRVLPLLNFNF